MTLDKLREMVEDNPNLPYDINNLIVDACYKIMSKRIKELEDGVNYRDARIGNLQNMLHKSNDLIDALEEDLNKSVEASKALEYRLEIASRMD